jgi:hypothetical protein
MNTPEQSEATRTAERTREALKSKGWCVWTCFHLDGDKIIVAADEYQLPMDAKYPVYTESELKELFDKDISTIKLVHHAKKLVPGTQVVKE